MNIKKNFLTYLPILISFLFWSLFIYWLDYVSDDWGLSFYVIIPFALAYPLIELALRPIAASFLYSKVVKIIGLIISALVGAVVFIQVELNRGCCGAAPDGNGYLSLVLPILLAAPFVYYSFIQDVLWRRYISIEDRKLFILKSRIIAASLIIILVANTIWVASSFKSSKTSVDSSAQNNFNDQNKDNKTNSKVEDSESNNNQEKSEPAADEYTEYASKLVSADTRVSLNIPKGWYFVYDVKQGFAMAVGLEKMSNQGDSKVTYKTIYGVGGPSVSSVTVSMFNKSEYNGDNYKLNYQPVGPLNDKTNKFYNRTLAKNSDGYFSADFSTYVYETIYNDKVVIVTYNHFDNEDSRINEVESMVNAIEII